VATDARSRGIGGTLLDHLIVEAPTFGYWKLVGMIFPENAAGLALAHSRGFTGVGVFRSHGRLQGDWRDISLVERHLEVT
jgi:phosphinothricin acetyltransferase